jgi:ATP-dependent Clp protease adaptor protein ClpS
MGTHNGGAEVTDYAWNPPNCANLDRAFPSATTPAWRANEPKDPTKEPAEGDDVELEDKPISATPRRYKVIFHNDDYTTMEFVVEVLKRFFHKTDTEAMHIMLTVHKSGAAVAGVYTRDVAETKSTQVMDYARENGMPLLLTTEPE